MEPMTSTPPRSPISPCTKPEPTVKNQIVKFKFKKEDFDKIPLSNYDTEDETNNCMFCRYKTVLSLKHHYNTEHRDMAVRCVPCHKFLFDRDEISRHLSQFHNATTFHQIVGLIKRKTIFIPDKILIHHCASCAYKSVYLANVWNHRIEKHGDHIRGLKKVRVFCKLCNCQFTDDISRHLHYHFKMMQIKGSVLGWCFSCDKELPDKTNLYSHFMYFHQEDCIECLKCNKLCWDYKSVRPHFNEYHGYDIYSEDRDFMNKLINERKIRIPGNGVLITYSCTKCDVVKKFNKLEDLKLHAQMEHGCVSDNDFEADCRLCNRKLALYQGKTHLKMFHLQKIFHNDDSFFTCGICSRQTKDIDSLKDHFEDKHPSADYKDNSEPPKFSFLPSMICKWCNKCFYGNVDKQTGVKHFKAQHDGEFFRMRDFEFVCRICPDKLFENGFELLGHCNAAH